MKKIILITGGNSGIGFAAAQALAGQGCHVVLVCRNSQKAEAARATLVAETGNPDIDWMEADLLSLSSIRTFAAEFNRRYHRLDVLYNNAGATFFDRRETPEGLEYNFLVNYLAPFLLTNLLLSALRASAPSRIITISGMYHRKGRIDFDDLQLSQHFSAMQAANNAQLAKLLFTYELARRLAGTGVTANAFHPGAVRTNLQKHLPWYYQLLAAPARLFFRSPAKGAETAVYLATSPEVAEVSGQFFFDKKPVPSAPPSYDEEIARRLWEVSEWLVGMGKSEMGSRKSEVGKSVSVGRNPGIAENRCIFFPEDRIFRKTPHHA